MYTTESELARQVTVEVLSTGYQGDTLMCACSLYVSGLVCAQIEIVVFVVAEELVSLGL